MMIDESDGVTHSAVWPLACQSWWVSCRYGSHCKDRHRLIRVCLTIIIKCSVLENVCAIKQSTIGHQVLFNNHMIDSLVTWCSPTYSYMYTYMHSCSLHCNHLYCTSCMLDIDVIYYVLFLQRDTIGPSPSVLLLHAQAQGKLVQLDEWLYTDLIALSRWLCNENSSKQNNSHNIGTTCNYWYINNNDQIRSCLKIQQS